MGKVIGFFEMGEKRMATIFDVANYFISKANNEDENFMTPLKLQKLCYYAQAWSLVWDDKELFKEDFQAWVHGPANYKLYKKYDVGKNVYIDNVDSAFNMRLFNKDQLNTLDAVWTAYGKFSGSYLEQLTHQEDPWKLTRGTLPPGMGSNVIIDKKFIKEYYSKEYGEES
jgi:uncharacterized phage-associated protein